MRYYFLILFLFLNVSCNKIQLSRPVELILDPPANPINPSVNVLGETAIQLNWESGGGTTSDFKISYQTGATPPVDCNSGTTISESLIDEDDLTYNISGLTNNTQYSFLICAINSNDTPDVSSGVSISGATSSAAAPPNPTAFTASINSTTQITLSWTNGGGTTADYRIAYKLGAVAPINCASDTMINEILITGTSKVLTGLDPDTQYSFLVCAINANATPDVSSGASVTATTLKIPPPNPIGPGATVNSNTQITLSWTSGGGSTSDYRISYLVGATAPTACEFGTTISEGSIAGTSHPVSGLAASTQYSFRICAINSNPSPDVSSGVTVTATTSGTFAPPPSPDPAISFVVNSTTEITLHWISGGGTTSGYRIAYLAGLVTPADCSTGTTISESSISGTSHVVSGLSAGTQYRFLICAINANPTPDVSSGRGIVATTDATPAPFVSIWRTTGVNENITLPLRIGHNYNFTVDWGDSTTSSITAFNDPDITHQYATANDYTVTITGLVEAWWFNNGGDKLKIIEVTDFGEVGWSNLDSAFYGCSNLESFAGGTTSGVTDMKQMFNGASSLTSLDVSNFDMTNVTGTRQMFANVSSLTTLDLSHFNTVTVSNMKEMFLNMTSLATLNLSNFKTSNVTRMWGMFSGVSALTTLDVSSFDTSIVTEMHYMFNGMADLTSLDLTNFDTSQVIEMSSMFNGTNALASLDLSSFNTANVTSMSWMFMNSSSLTSLDLSSFSTANVVSMDSMFNGASSLTSLDLSNFITTDLTSFQYMFSNTSSLTSLNISNFNTSLVTDMTGVFYGASSLTSLNLSNFNTSSSTSMWGMFKNMSSLTSINLANFNTTNVTNMSQIFENTTSLTLLDTNNWNINNASGSTNVFNGANAGLVVNCNQGGSPGTGTFFGKACN